MENANMENTAESSNLKQLYNIVDWIDFGLVFAVVFYYGRLVNNLIYDLQNGVVLGYREIINLSVEYATLTSIALLVASMAVCITFVFLLLR